MGKNWRAKCEKAGYFVETIEHENGVDTIAHRIHVNRTLEVFVVFVNAVPTAVEVVIGRGPRVRRIAKFDVMTERELDLKIDDALKLAATVRRG